ncbi:UDP-N-acetylhexosamine pyrophosphorylase-like protein 1 [Pundamilia nyererei]|uniref:UDP-N-acetylhexosamine pyrophosphorylase-like protein 1 n=1 Tax=Pundamilia nyererei TaxID=303518 RepID=A0A9Y3RXA5_9CICH|nr:PREDICTED: UDP-N-acetylhexosamine pyrophosphorylase-like protein 1 [Pundamilia nyererei]
MPCFEQVKQGLESAGQAHVLQFWPELCEEERDVFLEELAQLDLKGLKDHCEGAAKAAASPPDSLDHHIEPIPPEFIGSVKKSGRDSLEEWERRGKIHIWCTSNALRHGGGANVQTLPSVLFRYIMTSEFTLAPTETFFKENNYFGLEPTNIVMFEQRMIPAVTFDGKVILKDKGKIAMAPDGNGGLYQALVDNKVLEDMKKRGVKYLHVYCVDNILVKMADPVFIGFCVSKGADCGAKVVEKAYPTEPVGVVCRVRGVSQVVEYSEVQPQTAELQGPGGELVYSAGNICNHFFTRSFLQDVAEKYKDQLKQHVALKKVPFVDAHGVQVKPSKSNGIKMEKFVFDVFEFSRNFVAFEVVREDEFSPLKNADGSATDNPTTARNSLLAQHCRWVTSAGATLLDKYGNPLPLPSVSADDSPPAQCEISPLVSYFGEGLEQLLKGRTIHTPFVLDEKQTKKLQAQ